MKHLDMGSLSFLAAVAMPIMEATSKVNRRTQKVNNGWHCFWSSVETPWTLYSCSGSQRMQSVREGSFFFFVFVCCGLCLFFHALLCDETFSGVTELPPYGPRLQDSSDRNTAAMISVVRRRHQHNAVYLHFSRCPNFLPLFLFIYFIFSLFIHLVSSVAAFLLLHLRVLTSFSLFFFPPLTLDIQ